MFEPCANCNRRTFFRYRDAEGKIFCSSACRSYIRHPGFCLECKLETTSESTGTIGKKGRRSTKRTMLLGDRNRCPTCNSTIRRLWLLFGIMPVFPMGQYRVLYYQPDHADLNTFHSRRIARYSQADVPGLMNRAGTLAAEGSREEAMLLYGSIARFFPKLPAGQTAGNEFKRLRQEIEKT